MTTRDEIVEEARSWIGERWVHQGRTRGHGIDCAGLVIKVGHAKNLGDYDCTDYARRTNGQEFLQHFRKTLDPLPRDNRTPGNIAVFRDSAFPCHTAIIAERNGRPSIIHSHASRRGVVEEEFTEKQLGSEPSWKSKLVGIFSYRGLED